MGIKGIFKNKRIISITLHGNKQMYSYNFTAGCQFMNCLLLGNNVKSSVTTLADFYNQIYAALWNKRRLRPDG